MDISDEASNTPQVQLVNGPLVTPVTPRAALMSSNGYISPEELRLIPTPDPTRSHKPIPHYELNDGIDELLGYRKIGVTKTQIAVSKDGMECYLIKHLDTGFEGGHFTLGARNSNNRKFAVGFTLGYNIGVCDNGMFYGDFMASRKHTSKTNIRDILSINLDEAQRFYEPLRKDIERWRETQLSERDAKLRLYGIFIEEQIDLPRHYARRAHEEYFNPTHPDHFPTGYEWSFQNALTYIIQDMEPIRRQQAEAAIGQYFKNYGR